MPRRKRSPDALVEFLPDWQRHLRAANRSERTITVYTSAARALLAYLPAGTPAVAVTHREINAFIESLRNRGLSPSYVNQHYRSLQQWFRYLVNVEQEIKETPFRRLTPPLIPELQTDVFTDDELARLVALPEMECR